MADNVVTLPQREARPASTLRCQGATSVLNAIQFHFSRPVTTGEMNFLLEVVQRAVACMPDTEDGR